MPTRLPPRRVEPRDRLIVALDVPTHDDALALVERIGPAATFYKVGLELFLAGHWPDLVTELVERRHKKVFVDLKLFDVPETVHRAVRQLDGCGATFATVHGNDAMLAAAAEAATDLGVLAVTVLTSLDRGDLDDLGFAVDVERLVVSRARRAVAHGCAGVVASGRETRALRAALGDGFVVVTPGIRPVENRPSDDQKRVTSPAEAFAGGADHIVVGRPIRDAPDPRAAAEVIQAEIAAVFNENHP